MTSTIEDPIHLKWTSPASSHDATASQVVHELGAYKVDELPDGLLPYLAAATVEIASVAEIAWRFSADGAVVALLRMMSRGALAKPDASGPHTQRLHEQLEALRGSCDLRLVETPHDAATKELADLDETSRQLLANWHGFVVPADPALP